MTQSPREPGAPERIWLDPIDIELAPSIKGDGGAVEYVRADAALLMAAERLEAECERCFHDQLDSRCNGMALAAAYLRTLTDSETP